MASSIAAAVPFTNAAVILVTALLGFQSVETRGEFIETSACFVRL